VLFDMCTKPSVYLDWLIYRMNRDYERRLPKNLRLKLPTSNLGKRPERGWNNLSGMWGKRAAQWNNLHGMIGKKRAAQWNK